MEQPETVGVARFLTLADVADVLSVSVAEVSRLVRNGELVAMRVGSGGSWRVERVALESFIDAQHEEVRRMSLWHQSDIASIIDFPQSGRAAL
ncbi:MAG: helix-turn-helix domain-containing protein [Microbacteriaceae bacterium]